jgi:hypothetical protein
MQKMMNGDDEMKAHIGAAPAILLATIGLAAGCATPTQQHQSGTQTSDAAIYERVDGWIVMHDLSIDGCFAITEYDDGTVLRIGIWSEDGQPAPYVLLGNGEWSSIEYQKRYPVEVFFGEETPWEGYGFGFSFDPPENQPYLTISFTSESAVLLFDEFMREQYVRVQYDGRTIMKGSLRNSYQAGTKILECQAGQTRSSSDPFKSPKRNVSSRDRFRS